MDTFNYKCVLLKDFCEAVGWNHVETVDHLMNSDISFGNNDDTLVTPHNLADICEKELPENFEEMAGLNPDDDLMISLGC